MELKKLDQDFSVCKVKDYSLVDLGAEYCFTGKTDEEDSLVCATSDVPSNVVERDDGWKGFRIQGVLDFSLIGILAGIAEILAENGISIFAISTYNTDYVLMKPLLDHRGYGGPVQVSAGPSMMEVAKHKPITEGARMYDMILQQAVALGADGLERLISDLKAAVPAELGAGGGEPARRPGCGRAGAARRGRTPSGSQRRLCGGCGRSFTAAAGGVLALSKPGAATWSSYVEGMAAGESPRALAARCYR